MRIAEVNEVGNNEVKTFLPATWLSRPGERSGYPLAPLAERGLGTGVFVSQSQE